MMNKSRIHEDLGEFWGYSQNLIKSDDKLSWKIRDFSNFGKKTLRQIHEIKNHSIWISICGEIKEQNQR